MVLLLEHAVRVAPRNNIMRIASVVFIFICSPFFKCCFFADYDWKIFDYEHHDLQYKVSVIVDLLPVRRARKNCEIVENFAN